MLWDVAKVVVLSLLIVEVLIGLGTYLITGEFEIIPLPIIAIIGSGFFILLALVALLVYRNRFRATFAITPNGVRFASGKRERGLTWLTLMVGLFSRTPVVAGAGMLAYARETVEYPWEVIRDVKVYPDARVISLRTSWRTLLRLHCPPELFDEAVALTRAYVARTAKQEQTAEPVIHTHRSSLALVLWIIVAVLATYATQAMFYIDSETLRLALAGGLLVILAGILTGISVFAAVILGFIVNAWLVMATFDAVSPYTETGELVVSAGGAFVLITMSIIRPFFQPLNPKAVASPERSARRADAQSPLESVS